VIAVVVVAASAHENAVGITLLDKVAADTDTVEKALVDQGFKNAVVAHGEKVGIEVEVVERNPAQTGFVPQAKHLPRSSESRVYWAMTAVILRQLTSATEPRLAHRMTGGELTLGAVLARLEEREREITAQAETTREQITQLTTQLDELGRAAEEVRITRKTLLELPAPQPPALPVPGPPETAGPSGLPADHGGVHRGRPSAAFPSAGHRAARQKAVCAQPQGAATTHRGAVAGPAGQDRQRHRHGDHGVDRRPGVLPVLGGRGRGRPQPRRTPHRLHRVTVRSRDTGGRVLPSIRRIAHAKGDRADGSERGLGKTPEIRPSTRVDSQLDKGCASDTARVDKGCALTAPPRRTVTLRVRIAVRCVSPRARRYAR
jgi:hypothetical protein